jgi:hypothetical protein
MDLEQLVAQYLAKRQQLQQANKNLLDIADQLTEAAGRLKQEELLSGLGDVLTRAVVRLRTWRTMSATASLYLLDEAALPRRVKEALDACYSLQRELAGLSAQIPEGALPAQTGLHDPL